MALLTLEGFEVPVVPGTRQNDEPYGDYARAYSSQMRSDRRAVNRIIPVSGSIFDTSDDAVALRAILNTPGKVLAGGTMIGDDAYFHVRNVQITPVTVDRSQFAFELHESDDAPSPILFSFDGDAPGSYTFTRSGTVGPYTSASGILRNAAANVARREYLWRDGTYTVATRPDTAGLLLEATAINLPSTDDITAYSDVGSPVVTSGIDGPAGGSDAYRIEDDSAASSEAKILTVTFTGNAQKCVTFVVREGTMPGSGVQQLRLFDSTAGADRLSLDISAWPSGSPTVAASAGTYLGKRYVGNGYWALYGLSSTVTAANTNRIQIHPAGTANQTGTIDVYRVNAFNLATPPWSIFDAGETLNDEAWYAPYASVPQAHSGYIRFIEGMHPTWAAHYRLLQISDGTGSGTNPKLLVYRPSGGDSYTVAWETAAGAVTSSVDLNPAWGDDVELFWTQTATGMVTLHGRKNSGSISSGSTSSALALTTSYSAQRVYLSHPGEEGTQVILSAKIMRGVQSTTYIAEVARGRLHPRTADHGALCDMAASVSASLSTVAAESP